MRQYVHNANLDILLIHMAFTAYQFVQQNSMQILLVFAKIVILLASNAAMLLQIFAILAQVLGTCRLQQLHALRHVMQPLINMPIASQILANTVITLVLLAQIMPPTVQLAQIFLLKCLFIFSQSHLLTVYV